MRQLTVSAPLSLSFGESGLELGQPVLFTALSLRTYVTVAKVKIFSITPEPLSPALKPLLDHIKQFYKQTLPAFKISVNRPDVSLPNSNLLLSLWVATAGAVSWYLKELWNPHTINTLVYDLHKDRDPAWGAKTSVTTFGGFVWFRQELSFLKSIWQLPIKLPPAANRFYLEYNPSRRPELKKNRKYNDVKSLAEAFKSGRKVKIDQYLKKFQNGQTGGLSICLKKSNNKSYPVSIGEEGVKIEHKE